MSDKLIKTFLVTLLVMMLNLFALVIGESRSYAKSSDVNDLGEVMTYSMELKLKKRIQKIEIHTEKRFLAFSQMVKEILQTSAISVFDYFEYSTDGTLHINIYEDATLANGSATVFPDIVINLNPMQPLGVELLTSDYHFIEGLVLHELAHILHLDQTDGLFGVIQNIFGSVGKLGTAMVPRWFIEGIGVWVESTFTSGGRLRSSLMTAMLYKNILDPNFCQSVDCFDNPGDFPDASYAYWMGGHFLAYIEKIKPKSILCLIKANARKFPFRLNSSFKECTGKMANEHYHDYRAKLIRNIEKSKFKFTKNKIFKKLRPIMKDKAYMVLSKNFHLYNQFFYRLEREDDSEKIVFTDLKTSKRYFYKSDNKIEQLIAPTKQDIQSSVIPLVGYPYLSMEVEREISLISLNAKKEEVIDAGDSSQYVFASKYFLKNNGINWELYKEKSLIYSWKKLVAIYHPRLVDGKIYYQSFYLKKNKKHSYQFEFINLNKVEEGIKVLFKKKDPFELMANFSNEFLFKADGRLELINVKKRTLYKYELENIKDLSAIRFNLNHVVFMYNFLPNQFYHFKGNLNSFLGSTSKKVSKQINLSPKRSKRFDFLESELDKKSIKSYPSFSHFKPSWWFLSFGGGTQQTSAIGGQTVLTDPRGHHSIGLKYRYFGELEKSAPAVSYTYMPKDFSLFASFEKSYNSSEFDQSLVDEQTSIAGFGYKFDNTRINLFPKIFYINERIKDFLSQRELGVFGLSLDLAIGRVNTDDIFQLFKFNSEFSLKKPKSSKEFKKVDLLTNLKLRLMTDLDLLFQGSYAKLFKNNFRNGVVFSGGLARHSFHGIGSNDAFGNEVSTIKTELDYAFYRPYGGYHFLPIYFKEFHFLLGQEFLKTDFIKYSKKIYRNERIGATFVGLRTKMNIIYHFPVDFDLILSKVNPPGGAKDELEFSVNFMASGF